MQGSKGTEELYKKIYDAAWIETKSWQEELDKTVGKELTKWLEEAIVKSSGAAAHTMIKHRTETAPILQHAGEIEQQKEMWQNIWKRDLASRSKMLKDIDWLRKTDNKEEAVERPRWDTMIKQLKPKAGIWDRSD